MEPSNVIIVNDYNYIQGGASKVAITTANLLQHAGVKVIYFCGVAKADAADLDPAITVVSVDQYDCLNDPHRWRAIGRGIANRHAKKQMRTLLKTLDPQDTVIHVHGWTKDLSASFLSACHRRGFKVVLTAHDYFSVCPNGGLYNFKQKQICHHRPMGWRCLTCNCDSRSYQFKLYRLWRQFYQNRIHRFTKRFDLVCTISALSEDQLKQVFRRTPIVRLPNPISTVPGPLVDVERNVGYVFVGRLSPEKGIAELCATIAPTQYQLHIVGDGPLYSELVTRYQDCKNLIFHGWQNAQQTLNIMRQARALLFPSRWYEVFPLVVYEAMAQGVPCIVADVTAAAETINGKNGLLYDVKQPATLLSAIERLEQNLAAYGQNAYQTFWEHDYSEEKYLVNLLAIYARLLNEGGK